jgi:hypothetical protein
MNTIWSVTCSNKYDYNIICPKNNIIHNWTALQHNHLQQACPDGSQAQAALRLLDFGGLAVCVEPTLAAAANPTSNGKRSNMEVDHCGLGSVTHDGRRHLLRVTT